MVMQVLKKGQKPLNVVGGYRYEEDTKDSTTKGIKDPHKMVGKKVFTKKEQEEKNKKNLMQQKQRLGLMFKKGGSVKRAEGSSPKGETLDQELESFGKRARSGELGPGKKKSDLPLVDQYEVDRKMGRFSGSFKEYMDSKEAKQFKRGGVAMKHSDKTGRAMKKTDADAKGRAMPKAKGKMAGGMMTKGMMAGGMATKGMMAGGMMTKGYAAGGAAMPMVMKDGKKVPAFAADGKGKMAKGGMAGGMAKGGMAGGMSKVAAGKATRGYGAARRGS